MRVELKDKVLLSVEKPSRYTGNEWNAANKNPMAVDVRFAFCFPDVYEVGMSHLGMKILYHLMNERQDTFCERVFAPWFDMESRMREEGIPLFALESRDSLDDFDLVGFTLQYEMSYTNILNMLELGKIPVLSVDRKEGAPFICAGGPCAYNPEPLADFIDFFMMGEGEEILPEVIEEYKKWKNSGSLRDDFLERIAKIQGIYVPKFYDVKYNEDNTVKEISVVNENAMPKVKKRIIKDLDATYFPDKFIVPYTGIVHDRVMLELFRGCIRGCRFCQAGFIYRPVRERTPKRLLELANKLIRSTGYEEISLTSLSTSDYTELETLTDGLLEEMEGKKVNLALPSLRVDSFSLELMEKASKVRKSGLTFAPEAGTQRMRDVINKGVTEEDLLNSVSIAFEGGWSTVKLYFMIGLPTETLEDVEGIAVLGEKVVRKYRETPKEKRAKGLKVTVSTSTFVPKPFTPFQWEAQDDMITMREKQDVLKRKIGSKSITYNWHDSKTSFMEGVIARGDRRIGKVIYSAWQKGSKFDGWNEGFRMERWLEAFAEVGLCPEFYASRKRNFEEVLPWDHIDVGVSKTFLIEECKKAYAEQTTNNCRSECAGCNVSSEWGGICFE